MPGPDQDAAEIAARHALQGWGCPDGPLTLVRHSQNVLFRTTGRNALAVRVAERGIDPRHGGTIAARAAALGIAALAPADLPPVLSAGHWVTAYPWHDQDPHATLDWAWLGSTVRAIHAHTSTLTAGLEVPNTRLTVDTWYPGRITDRIAALTQRGAVLAADLTLLTDLATDALDEARTLPPSDPVLLHFDVHPGNVLHTHDRPLIIDWDGAAYGPWWFDHLPANVHSTRFGAPGAMNDYVRGYGADPRDLPGFTAFSALKQISQTLWLGGLIPHRPHLVVEWEHRMDTFRGLTTGAWSVH